MTDAAKFHGQINQALYFARLLATHAHSIEQAVGDAGQFNRQQAQCYCEASLDALYRAFYFLAQSCCAQGVAASSAFIDPQQWPERLAREQQARPAPFLRELLAGLQPGQTLAHMLAAYAALWQVKSRRSSAAEISATEIRVAAADCRAWYDALTHLHARMQEQAAEF
ncbi:MAG: hypothetical protein HKO71_07000 [Pseudomonadales bacterium]|nr:hypothetical protein [Pseudomonadales bacterium]